MLFKSGVERTGGPASPGESTFDYLQRSNRQEAIQRCRWIDEWFESLPPNVRPAFESRLKAKSSRNFHGALFELQVHEILRRLNCMVEVEANFPGTKHKLDFLARNEGQTFYVEATISGFGQGVLSGNKNEHDAWIKIRENISNPHSDIWLEGEGELSTTLGTSRVVEPFRKLLNSHTPEEVRLRHSRGGLLDAPSTEVREGGWVLRGRLAPPSPPSSTGRVSGPARAGAVDGSQPLLRSLSKKAKKWRGADFKGVPLLVAVNACHSEFFWDDIDIKRALCAYPYSIETPETFYEILSCISGVIIFENTILGNEVAARVQLYRNGDASIPACLQFLLEEQRLGDLLSIEP